MGEKETEAVLGLRKGVRERGPTKDFPTFTGQTVRPFLKKTKYNLPNFLSSAVNPPPPPRADPALLGGRGRGGGPGRPLIGVRRRRRRPVQTHPHRRGALSGGGRGATGRDLPPNRLHGKVSFLLIKSN